MALTPKQERFVSEYLIDLNATQAAIRAGYSAKTASETGWENLRKPQIVSAIQEAKAKREKRTNITQDMVLAEFAKIGFSDIRKAVRWGGVPEAQEDGSLVYPVELVASEDIDHDTAAAIGEVSLTASGVKIKMHDKLNALEKIARHLGMFSGEGPNVTVNVPFDGFVITDAKPD